MPYSSPPLKKKKKIEPKYKLFKISYSILDMQSFYICPDIPVEVIRDFFNLKTSGRKSQKQQKLAKKITHTLQFR